MVIFAVSYGAGSIMIESLGVNGMILRKLSLIHTKSQSRLNSEAEF